MEGYTLKIPLPAYLYSANFKKLKKHTKNPMTKNMMCGSRLRNISK